MRKSLQGNLHNSGFSPWRRAEGYCITMLHKFSLLLFFVAKRLNLREHNPHGGVAEGMCAQTSACNDVQNLTNFLKHTWYIQA